MRSLLLEPGHPPPPTSADPCTTTTSALPIHWGAGGALLLPYAPEPHSAPCASPSTRCFATPSPQLPSVSAGPHSPGSTARGLTASLVPPPPSLPTSSSPPPPSKGTGRPALPRVHSAGTVSSAGSRVSTRSRSPHNCFLAAFERAEAWRAAGVARGARAGEGMCWVMQGEWEGEVLCRASNCADTNWCVFVGIPHDVHCAKVSFSVLIEGSVELAPQHRDRLS